MNKKGFTLIELLAVITIMGILLVVAIPAITRTIQGAREDTALTSVKTFVDTANNELISESNAGHIVEDGKYPIMSDGNICLESSITNADDCLEKDIFIVEVEGQKVDGGVVEIKKQKVVKIFNVEIIDGYVNQNDSGKYYFTVEPVEIKNTVCQVVSGDANFNIGTAYSCEVASGTKYTFYVLSVNGDTVNLIMNKNLVDSCPWYDAGTGVNYNNCGPITAYQKIFELTRGWTNVDNISQTYKEGDISISAVDGLMVVGSKDPDCEMISEYPAKARLPFKTELDAAGAASASFLTDNLEFSDDYWANERITTTQYAASTLKYGSEVLGQGNIGIRVVISMNKSKLS